MKGASTVVYTIGHSNQTFEEFLALLRLHQIEAVGDVRSSPFSKFTPQFNRDLLEAALKKAGVHYVFLGRELGARSPDPGCYVDGRVQYGRLRETALFQEGLDRVIRGAQRYRVALMCAEKEPLECHRSLLVSNALEHRGVSIVHIHQDGRLEEHAHAMQRLFELTGVPKQDLFRTPDELLAEAMQRQERQIAYVDQDQASGKPPEAFD